MAEICLENLRHSYYPNPECDKDFALRSVDLLWEEGLAYALLGPSGSGKTTLLNILSGLLEPSEGRVLFNGRDVTKLKARERNIAQVFQFPVVYETMTVGENLSFPLRTRKIDPKKIRERVAFIANELGLTPLLEQKARTLTAEQKQRISLGRGLVREDVAAILLDEPLTVIDPAEKMSLRRTLKTVQKHLGVKLIYVTHDQHEAMTLADRVIVMNEGEIVQIGTPQDLFERPAHRFVGYFIGSPGTNFVDCRINGKALLVGKGTFALSDEVHRHLSNANRPLTFGIRPDFLTICDQQNAEVIPGIVKNIENHGDERIFAADIGGEIMMVRIPDKVSVHLGENVFLRPDPQFISIFSGNFALDLPANAFGGEQ